jgi:hypothetical protein
VFRLAVRIDGKDFVMQELIRSGAGCGCMTETHLDDFFWLSPAAWPLLPGGYDKENARTAG